MEKKKRLSRRKKPFFAALVLLVTAATLFACSNPPAPEKDAPGTVQNLMPAPQTETPELATPDPTVFIGAPEGFIANDAGASDAEVAAVFTFMMDREYQYLPEKLDIYGFHLCFYARQDWHGGALLAAGESERDGEITAELYFVKNGELLMYTRGSDVWSINYTHFEGETIVYGKSFAWDNQPLATDEVTAEFCDGTTVTVEMAFEPNDTKVINRGFICVAPSVTWLRSLEIKKGGEVVADDASPQFIFSPEDEPWYGEEESIRNRTRFVHPCTAGDTGRWIGASGVYPSVTFADGCTQALLYWPDCDAHEGLPPDIWRSNNGRYERVEAKAASPIAAQLTAAADTSEGRKKIGELEIYEIYWADLSVKDDISCVSAGELVCPAEKGFYVLILITEYGCFSQMIRVV